MPEIKPSSVEDLIDIIDKHSSDIENGTYDITLDKDLTSQLPSNVSLFLIKHSRSSRLCIGKYSNDIDLLSLLSKDSDRLVRKGVAENMHTPPEILTTLANDHSSEVSVAVLQNANTPTFVLTSCLTTGNLGTLWSIAENPSAPPEILTTFAKSEEASLRYLVAKHPNTPTLILAILSKDSDSFVRTPVADNIHTPPDVLTILAKDEDSEVRVRVAFNPNTPMSVIAILKNDPAIEVREIAINRNKGCFIATAIYGSHFAPEVIILRYYRDHVMMKNIFGRLCVIIYYFVSPTIARFIRQNGSIKYIIRRLILDPLLCRINKINY